MATNNQPKKQQGKHGSSSVKPLGKVNFILMAACLILIVLGFGLMVGDGNTGTEFNYNIFETRRTIIGPAIALLGFVLMAVAIIYKPNKKD